MSAPRSKARKLGAPAPGAIVPPPADLDDGYGSFDPIAEEASMTMAQEEAHLGDLPDAPSSPELGTTPPPDLTPDADAPDNGADADVSAPENRFSGYADRELRDRIAVVASLVRGATGGRADKKTGAIKGRSDPVTLSDAIFELADLQAEIIRRPRFGASRFKRSDGGHTAAIRRDAMVGEALIPSAAGVVVVAGD